MLLETDIVEGIETCKHIFDIKDYYDKFDTSEVIGSDV